MDISKNHQSYIYATFLQGAVPPTVQLGVQTFLKTVATAALLTLRASRKILYSEFCQAREVKNFDPSKMAA